MKNHFLISSIYDNYGEKNIFEKQLNFGDDLTDYLIFFKKNLNNLNFTVTQKYNKKFSYQGFIFLDHPADQRLIKIARKNKIPLYLFMRECIVIHPLNWNIKLLNIYNKIFTFNPEFFTEISSNKLTSNVKRTFFSRTLKLHENFWNSRRENNIIAIYTNKVRPHEKSNYKYRDYVISNLSNTNRLALYGHGWNSNLFHLKRPFNILNKILTKLNINKVKRNRYYGLVEDKIKISLNFNFCLCFENTINFNGYITEKIFDSFKAGCIPLYLGAPNITDFIPKNTFIQIEHNQSWNSILKKIDSLSQTDINDYRANIFQFMTNNAQKFFSHEKFFETFINSTLNEK